MASSYFTAPTTSTGPQPTFKQLKTLDTRKAESQRVLNKFKDRIPVIVEKHGKCELRDLPKKKFLVPRDLTIQQFHFVVRKYVTLAPEKALFLFIDNTLPMMTATMASIYDQHKDADGFLYVMYSSESTFGLS